jgi:hypothetical protein
MKLTRRKLLLLGSSIPIQCLLFTGCSSNSISSAQAATISTNKGRKQILQGTTGVPMPATAFASEATEPLTAGMTADQFKARLANGGTISLDSGDYIYGQPSANKNPVSVLALDTLELKNGARIVTNGTTLVIFVNRLISEDGRITAFKEDTKKAAAGAPGVAGLPGGLVSIHVIDQLTGIVHVDLTGQDGGDGLPGAPGSKGQSGVKGNKAVDDGILGCKSGGGNGTDGGKGGPGQRGFDGGTAGRGGTFELYNVGRAPIPSASYTFIAASGKGGVGGPGGAGGLGGDQGQGGDGDGSCHGGSPGRTGAQGDPGDKGIDGAVSAPGPAAIVKNIDLEFVYGGELKRPVFKLQR